MTPSHGHTEQDLRELEERFRLFVSNVVDYAIVILDPQGRVISWNAGAERLKGYGADEIIGSHFSRFYVPEDVRTGKPEKELRIAEKNGRFEDLGWRIRKDGSRFWANTIITALRNDTGQLVGFGKIIRDLSERIGSETALRGSEETLRLLVESVEGYAIFMLDTQGTVLNWNLGAERIKGYKANEIIGQNFSRFYPEEDVAHGKPQHELEVAAKEGRFEDEGFRVRKDGSKFLANIIISPIQNSGGDIIGFSKLTHDLTATKQVQMMENVQRATFNVLEDFAVEKLKLEDTQRATYNILEDFSMERNKLQNMQMAAFNILEDLQEEKVKLKTEATERERAEAKLETANKELEAFSYSVSHDLRAPLRGVDGFSQALLEDYSDKLDDQGKQYLKYVREASQQMAQLIDDLLNLSRMSRGEIYRKEIDLSSLVASTLETIRKSNPEKKTEFVIEPGLIVNADQRLLRIALENLLGNAWKFTSKRQISKIEFGMTEQNNKNVYFVRDNGAGFDMIYAKKLFGAFQRLHSANEFPGTGIGLATVRRIIHRHGGEIWAESEVDKGATFYFTLGA
jgi:PAS domain S-box-containing protein